MIIMHPDEIVDVQDLPQKYQYGVEGIRRDEISEKDALFDLFSDTGSSDDSEDEDGADTSGHEGAQHDDLGAPFAGVLPPEGVNLKDMVSQIEIDMIKQALAATDGVVARAAEILQMRRTTLVEKIKKYGISQATD